MAKGRLSYSVDKSRFEPLGGSARRYRDKVTGEEISRARAIKLSQGASISSIRRIRAGEALDRRTLLERAYNRSGLPREARDEFIAAMNSLHPLDAPLQKGVDYSDWIEEYEDWIGDYDSMDWREFFADSGRAE